MGKYKQCLLESKFLMGFVGKLMGQKKPPFSGWLLEYFSF